jgi:SnoaL-like protein
MAGEDLRAIILERAYALVGARKLTAEETFEFIEWLYAS